MTHKAKTHNRPSPPVERLIEGLSSRYLLFGLGAIFVLDLFNARIGDVVTQSSA